MLNLAEYPNQVKELIATCALISVPVLLSENLVHSNPHVLLYIVRLLLY